MNAATSAVEPADALHGCRMACRMASVAFLLLGAAASPTRAGQAAPPVLVSLVVDAIEQNFSLISTAKVTVREVVEDATVSQFEVKVEKLSDGSELRVTSSPRNERRRRILLSDDRLRVDTSGSGPGTPRITETWALVAGVWTQHVPGSSAAWIRRTSELPGMFPIDPRQLGSDDIRRWLSEILREDAILSATLTSSADGADCIRILAKSASGVQTAYEFSAEDDFLPTRCETRWPDGSLLQLVEYEYRDVLGGWAKFPERVTRSFFAQGATRHPSSSGWRQRLVWELTSDVVLNNPIPDDAFEVKLPPGTRVNDNTRRAIYLSKTPLPRRNLLWGWCGAGLLACVTLLVSRRRRRHGTRE
jgi:hypothetical protein